jgi:hypothetical protein
MGEKEEQKPIFQQSNKTGREQLTSDVHGNLKIIVFCDVSQVEW